MKIHNLFEHKQLHTELKDIVDNLGYKQITSEEFAKQVLATTNNFLEMNKNNKRGNIVIKFGIKALHDMGKYTIEDLQNFFN